jgi:hypothetical protein
VVLRGLQALLGRLYDLQVEHDVYDFLVTDRRTLAGVVPVNDRREPDEELLLAETPDGAGVALYIDPAVLARLEASDPLGALTEENLADYCTALEGVSHFLYSIWRFGCDAPVSLLELECQAEVEAIRPKCMRGSLIGSSSMPASSPSNSIVTARRIAARLISVGAWSAAS